jgi:hypothetical protein
LQEDTRGEPACPDRNGRSPNHFDGGARRFVKLRCGRRNCQLVERSPQLFPTLFVCTICDQVRFPGSAGGRPDPDNPFRKPHSGLI